VNKIIANIFDVQKNLTKNIQKKYCKNFNGLFKFKVLTVFKVILKNFSSKNPKKSQFSSENP
jgi:hypothetical protein